MGALDGKVAIVTGAGTGLGREHALALAAAGATVVVNNRVSDPPAVPSAQTVAEEIAAAGGRASVDTASVADWSAMGTLVDRTVEEHGRLDIVINNAGVLVWDLIADIDEAAFDELIVDQHQGRVRADPSCVRALARGRRAGRAAGRADHQHRFRHRSVRLPTRRALWMLEGRGAGADDGDSDGDAAVRRHRQRDLARGADPDGQGHLPRGARGSRRRSTRTTRPTSRRWRCT